MPADQTPSLPTADAEIVDLKLLQPGAGLISSDHRIIVDLLIQSIGDKTSADDCAGLVNHVIALDDVPSTYRLQQLASLFTHETREIRHLLLEKAGEDLEADPLLKFDFVTTMLDLASGRYEEPYNPEHVADALFGVMHIADLPTEHRFAAAAPYVVDPSPEVRQTAIAVLLKHPEIVNDAIYDRLCDIFENAANHEDPKVEADALRALGNVQGFYATNTALDAR